MNTAITPSANQITILDWIRNGRGHAVVEAVAGSGKTTTLVLCASAIKGRGLFVAFNKHVASALATKLDGTAMEAKTIHGVGFAAVRYAYKRVRVEGNKYRSIVRGFEKEVKDRESLFGRKLDVAELSTIDDAGFPLPLIVKLADLARLELLDCESPEFGAELLDLVNHHALEMPEGLDEIVISCVRRALTVGKGITDEVDFTDMIWFPIVHNLKPYTYSWVFVDEAQDLSRCQLAMVRRCCANGGRMVFVGDRRQAIYGFAGADAASFQRIIDSTGATVLPLSVCYRCPRAVLDLARALCPQIEAAPNAEEGSVRTISRDNLVTEIAEGDMVLCRVNAPLLGICFELLADGISASVRGRDIGQGLIKIVHEIADRVDDFTAEFGEAITTWHDTAIEQVRRRGGSEDAIEQRCETIADQAECIRIIFGKTGAQSADALARSIERLFDNDRPSVVLSSVHRAKGLEEKRVFIVEPERLRNPRAKRDWMMAQEHNLHYVALTRAQHELVFVEGKRAARAAA